MVNKVFCRLGVKVACLLGLVSGTNILADGQPWEMLLKKDNLNIKDFQINSKRYYGMGKFPRQAFKTVWEDWNKLNSMTMSIGDDFMTASGSCYKLLGAASKYNDTFGLNKKTVAVAKGDGQKCLLSAIEKIQEFCEAPLNDKQLKALSEIVKKVPEEVAASAAGILNVVPAACELRDKSLKKVVSKVKLPELFSLAVKLTNNYSVPKSTRIMLEQGDMKPLTAGAMLLAQAIDSATKSIPKDA